MNIIIEIIKNIIGRIDLYAPTKKIILLNNLYNTLFNVPVSKCGIPLNMSILNMKNNRENSIKKKFFLKAFLIVELFISISYPNRIAGSV